MALYNDDQPRLRLSLREKRLFQALHKKDYSKSEMEQLIKGLDPDICSTQFYIAFARLCTMQDWKYVPENIKKRTRRVENYHRTLSALLLPALVKVAKLLSEHHIKTMLLSDTAMNVFYAKKMPIVSTRIDISVEPGKVIAAYQLLKKEFNLKYLQPDGALLMVNASPVALHWGFSMNGLSDEEGIWHRANTTELGGMELYVPSQEDMLIREAVEEYHKIFIKQNDNRELRFAIYADIITRTCHEDWNPFEAIKALTERDGFFTSEDHREKCQQAIKVMLEGYREAFCNIPSEDKSFVIERVYTQNFRRKQRMCAEVRRGASSSDLWIETDEGLGKVFADDRSDFAVLALINRAVRFEADILSDVPISGELKEALELQVIPALMLRWNRKERIELKIPVLQKESFKERRTAVLSGITLDDVWTIEEYCARSIAYRKLPDDILVIHAGGYGLDVNSRIEKKGEDAAKKYSLGCVKVDTNLQVLNDCERFVDVRFLRMAACMYAMANRYEQLTVSENVTADRVLHRMNELSYLDYSFASALSSHFMKFRPAGAGMTRSEKIADLISKKIEWSAECERDGILCGHCSSCHADIVILSIYKHDNWIKKCYNEENLESHFDLHLAYCMVEKKYNDIPELMKKKGVSFSKRSMALAKQIDGAQKRLIHDHPQLLARRILDVKA